MQFPAAPSWTQRALRPQPQAARPRGQLSQGTGVRVGGRGGGGGRGRRWGAGEAVQAVWEDEVRIPTCLSHETRDSGHAPGLLMGDRPVPLHPEAPVYAHRTPKALILVLGKWENLPVPRNEGADRTTMSFNYHLAPATQETVGALRPKGRVFSEVPPGPGLCAQWLARRPADQGVSGLTPGPGHTPGLQV